MSVIKSIDLVGTSKNGFEEAIKEAVNEAKKTLRNIRTVRVRDMEVLIENDKIKEYQVRLSLFFEIERA